MLYVGGVDKERLLSKKEEYKEPIIELSAKQIEQKKKYYQDKLEKLNSQKKVG